MNVISLEYNQELQLEIKFLDAETITATLYLADREQSYQ
jgi:hypothetical protein